MFNRVAITLLIFTLLLPWFTPAFSAFGTCPSCDTGACELSIAECRHTNAESCNLKSNAEEKNKNRGHEDNHGGAALSSGITHTGKHAASMNLKKDKITRTKKSAGKCGTNTVLSCADTADYSSSFVPAEPHILSLRVKTATEVSITVKTFLKAVWFKDPYSTAIDRPPALTLF